MFSKVLIANRGEIALRVIRACRELGIRTVAIYSEADRNALHVRFADEAVRIAGTIGYPVLLKAAFGGGGKGMRVVSTEAELRKVYETTEAEAEASFGNAAVFVEKFLAGPRHVEVQVAGDKHGAAVHVGERDCSMQRRHQKIIEEAPAPGLSADLRRRIREAAVQLVRHTNYFSVGTCEFLVQGEEFYFLEVNPRIQVEHPVTEEVSGIDLVQLQIRIAAGERIPFTQDEVKLRGHAIEIRVNAEDPWTFIPWPGRIEGYHAPGGPGIRIDSAVHDQAVVQPHYDSLVAKLIVWAEDRERAIRRVQWAMDEFVVEGIRTTLPIQRALVADPAFTNVRFHTRYIDEWIKGRKQRDEEG